MLQKSTFNLLCSRLQREYDGMVQLSLKRLLVAWDLPQLQRGRGWKVGVQGSLSWSACHPLVAHSGLPGHMDWEAVVERNAEIQGKCAQLWIALHLLLSGRCPLYRNPVLNSLPWWIEAWSCCHCANNSRQVSLAYGCGSWASEVRGTVKHYMQGRADFLSREDCKSSLRLFCCVWPSRPLGSCLKPTTEEPWVGREDDFPEFLYRGSNPRCGHQFRWSGSRPVETTSYKSRVTGCDFRVCASACLKC